MSNQSRIQSNLRIDDEIDLRQVFGALLRRKALIAKIATGSVLLTAIYAFTSKAVWEGQFQIVLARTQSVSSQTRSQLESNASIAKLIGVDLGNEQLRTEVEILKSPSVLKPVFDFVKLQKEKNGTDIKDWRYSDWLENLKIDLARGTSVLELTYRDTDKNLVLPVIEKISAAYQKYSGRDRKRGIKQGIKYLDEQIKIYRAKSFRSLRASQEYGIAQNLTTLQSGKPNDPKNKNAMSIETIRIEASNQIRNIDEQLNKLNQLDDKREFLMFLGRTVPGLASLDLPKQIDEMDLRLALLRSKYKDRDESIRTLNEQRQLLIEVFERQTYGYLNAQRLAAQARLKSTERPKGVLIKYRDLLRTAARDEATLTKLESERQILGLEQARNEDPWELISNPTLLDKPVAPRKKRMVVLGLFAGLIAGSGAAILVDRRTGLGLQRKRAEKVAAMLTYQTPTNSGWKHLGQCSRPDCRGSVGKISRKQCNCPHSHR